MIGLIIVAFVGAVLLVWITRLLKGAFFPGPAERHPRTGVDSASQDRSRVADDAAKLHTPTMTLENAALMALIGTILAMVILA
jgi:hypothetical protein